MRKILSIAFSTLVSSCSVQGDSVRSAESASPAEAEAHPAQTTETHWTYDDQAHWGETCAKGARQSPIDLREQALIDEPDIEFAYSAGDASIFNNGHAIEVSAPKGQTMTTGGETFTLLQAHFHDPSEHRLDGETFPMEMHLVHRRRDEGLAVVGVLFREGADNTALARLWAAMPAAVGREHAKTIAFDPSAFLPTDPTHFEYEGSLTTPPCTEGVRWFVMHAPLEASAEQIAALRSRIGENARSIQATNDRSVTEGR